MESADFIEPATSERAALIVFAPKMDGSLRFCIDYRQLDEVTMEDSYPIPFIYDVYISQMSLPFQADAIRSV